MRQFNLKALCVAATMAVAIQSASAAPDATIPFNKAVTETWIKEFLLNNPDVLEEALGNMQDWQLQKESAAQKAAIGPVWSKLLSDPSYPQTGPSDAAVTVVEFFDYHCGYCKQSFEQIMDYADDQDGNVRTIFVEFPILRPESELAAKAALAAVKQGKYLDLHKAFMGSRGVLDRGKIEEIAQAQGLNVATLFKDMETAPITEMLKRNHDMALTIGVSGTPAFLVNQTFVGGADMIQLRKLVAEGRSLKEEAVDQ